MLDDLAVNINSKIVDNLSKLEAEMIKEVENIKNLNRIDSHQSQIVKVRDVILSLEKKLARLDSAAAHVLNGLTYAHLV